MRKELQARELIESYVSDVLNDKVATCKHVRLAVERYTSDLQKQRTAAFPYYLSEDAASAACDFFPQILRHSIGDCAGEPFNLEPWQAFAIWNIFGWKRVSDRSRRFRKFFWTMARKNGKTTIAAGIAILLAMMDVNPITRRPEDVAEVILCATKKEQVFKVMYAEIERMRENSPLIKDLSTRINKQITFTHNLGSIRCVGSDKPYDGLNPHAVLMDETHAWREHHRKFYDTMMTGSGNRRQPLIGSTTTAGDDTSYIWQEEHDYATGVVQGDYIDESMFCYAFELDENDDPLDEANWIKSNPNLGVSISLDYLRGEATKAATSPVTLNRFTRYHCNRKVSSFERLITADDWNGISESLSDWRDADCITAGIDLGGRDDLAAYGMCARFPLREDEEGNMVWRYELSSSCFIVDETHRDLAKQPWAGWIATKKLNVAKYVTADLRDRFLVDADRYGIQAVAYDPYNAAQLGDELSQQGLEVLKMPQNPFHFHEPISEFIAAIREGRVTADESDPILRWCCLNMMANTNAQGKMMPDKKNSNEKIDAAVAVLMALRLAMLAPYRASGSLFIN